MLINMPPRGSQAGTPPKVCHRHVRITSSSQTALRFDETGIVLCHLARPQCARPCRPNAGMQLALPHADRHAEITQQSWHQGRCRQDHQGHVGCAFPTPPIRGPCREACVHLASFCCKLIHFDRSSIRSPHTVSVAPDTRSSDPCGFDAGAGAGAELMYWAAYFIKHGEHEP